MNTTLRNTALIATMLAAAGFAQAQTSDVKAATPKGETQTQYPVGLPEGQKAHGMESRSDVKAGASQSSQMNAVPKGGIPSQYPAGMTAGTPKPGAMGQNDRSDKKAEARAEAKQGTADLATPKATPPNAKQ